MFILEHVLTKKSTFFILFLIKIKNFVDIGVATLFLLSQEIRKVMPNKRDPNKVSIGVYIERDTRDLVKEILSEKGLTLTDFIYAQMLNLLNKEEDEIVKALEKFDGRRKVSDKKKKNNAK